MQLKKYKHIKNTIQGYWPGKDMNGGFGGIFVGDHSSLTYTPTLSKPSDLRMPGTSLGRQQLAETNNLKIGLDPNSKEGKFFNMTPKSKIDAGKIAGGINTAVNIAGDAVGAYSAISNAFNAPIKSVDDINKESGRNEGSIGGVSLSLQNQADDKAQMKQLNSENASNTMAAASSGAKLGSSVGSLLGPVGGAVGGIIGGIGGFIGGLFGGAGRKRRLRERLRKMKIRTAEANTARMDTAASTVMENDYNANHEDTQDDLLYANKGKSAMIKYNKGKSATIKYNKGKVWSPDGYHAGPTNSKVGFGESIVNFQTGKGTLITKGKKGVDNQNSSVRPGDNNTIFGNMINPYSGMLFSDQAAPLTARLELLNSIKFKNRGNQSSLSKSTAKLQQQELNKAKQQTLGRLQQLAEQQEEVHRATNTNSYNKGKLPRFDDGDDDEITKMINSTTKSLGTVQKNDDGTLSITGGDTGYGINALGGRDVVVRGNGWNFFKGQPVVFDQQMPDLNSVPIWNIPTGKVGIANIPNDHKSLRERGVNLEMPSGFSRDARRRLKSVSGPDAAVDQVGGAGEEASASVDMPSVSNMRYDGSLSKHQKKLYKRIKKAYGSVDGQSADAMPNTAAGDTQANVAGGVKLPEPIQPIFAFGDNYDRRGVLAFDGYGIEKFKRGMDPRAETVPMTQKMATEYIDTHGYDEDNPYSALFTGEDPSPWGRLARGTQKVSLEKPNEEIFDEKRAAARASSIMKNVPFRREQVAFRAPMNYDLDLSGNVRPSNPDEMMGVSANAQPGQEQSAALTGETTPNEKGGGKTKGGKKKGNFFKSIKNLLTSGSKSGLGDYHTLPGIASLLAGYSQYNRANSQDPKGSDIYASNPHEQQALQGLAKQRLNPYRYMRDMYDAERRGAYSINNSGGMSSGQRQANRVALALGSQRNIANMIRDVDEKNIGYKQKYYDTMLSAGNSAASRRQAANQYDFETYSKAHAAKEKMRQAGINNMLQALGDYQKNRFKRDMGREQLSLYNQSLDANQLKWLRELQEKASALGGSK